MKKLNNKAFTIIELLIASMVFTSVLLLCMEGITRIAKAYIKNASISRTSEFIKSFSEEISQQIKYGSSLPLIYQESDLATRICLGGSAYRVELNNPSDGSVKKKSDPNCSLYKTTSPDFFGDADNLAPSGMRVLKFGVNNSVDNIWDINIRVALGDNDLLDETAKTADFANSKCKLGISGSEYCAVLELSNTVNRRMANQ